MGAADGLVDGLLLGIDDGSLDGEGLRMSDGGLLCISDINDAV